MVEHKTFSTPNNYLILNHTHCRIEKIYVSEYGVYLFLHVQNRAIASSFTNLPDVLDEDKEPWVTLACFGAMSEVQARAGQRDARNLSKVTRFEAVLRGKLPGRGEFVENKSMDPFLGKLEVGKSLFSLKITRIDRFLMRK